MAKVLVVDDHAPNRELVVTLLNHQGHQSLEAADGAEALAMVRSQRPQLVICDILMPTMDGYEFVRQLRADAVIAATEVIFYTANYREREARHLAAAVGVSRVLIKPCIPEDIILAIDLALAREPAPEPVTDAGEFDREHLRVITNKLAEKADDLQNANLKLSALTDLNLQLASERDPDILLNHVCRGARQLIGAKYAVVCIKAKSNGQGIYFFSDGLPPEQASKLECPTIDRGLFGQVLTESKSRRILNVAGNPEIIGLPPGYPQVRNALVAPIVSLRLVYGWICLIDKVGAQEFSAGDERLLAIHAAQVGRIYENGSLYVQIERRAADLATEVAERKSVEEKIRRLNRVYAMLSNINGLIVHTREREELYGGACRIAVDAGDFIAAYIAMLDPDGKRLTVVASSNADAKYLQSLQGAINETMKPSSGHVRELFDRVFTQGLPAIVNNIEAELPFLLQGGPRRVGARSLAVLPLVVGGRTIGVFSLRAREEGFFDVPEIKLLTELAGDISFALDHIDKSERLDYLAYHDPLTGLANRTLFFDRVAQAVEAARRDTHMVAVIVMNIDRFKSINDALGRHAGDDLLKQIVSRFADEPKDLIWYARMTADTFAGMIPETSGADEVARRIESTYQRCYGKPYQIGGTELWVSAKAGVALFPNDGVDPETLFKNAEAALKKAKTGGERYLFHTQQMTERVAERLNLENKLRRALEQEEFVLHYQPKVTLDNRRITGVEALIRWNDPVTGLVPPMQFIPLLEETGLILEVGVWALRRAIRDHVHWHGLGLAAPRIAVNVSAVQLRLSDFVEVVRQAVKDGVTPPGIDIEITESVIMGDIEANIEKFRAIRGMGVNISIDDFGTGYSSLAYLSKLPVAEIKIDRSFIITMLQDANTMTLVSTVVALAHAMGLKVVAEGVDQEEQAEVLRRLGCDQMQGYLFSKPVPFEAITALLDQIPK